MNYPFSSIAINGREVELNSIISNSETPLSEFETQTFSFIKAWLMEGENFDITTSGSTGTPKTIVVTRSQMISSARMTIKALGLLPKTNALVCLTTQFIAGRMMLVRAFEAGMKIYAIDPSSNPLKNISIPIDFTAMVPLQLQTIIEGGAQYIKKLNQAKAILVGGAAVSPRLQKEIKNIEAPIFATYGMTETLSHIALQRLNGIHVDSSFKILPGIKVSNDDRGCLVIETPYLEEKIITNDIVEITSRETFKWLGRWDNVINSGGVKIIPESLESRIKPILDGLKINVNFFITGMPDEKLGSRVVLIMEASNILQKEDLLLLLKQTFSKHETPKDIISIAEFHYTETGKINRKMSLRLG